MADIDDELAEIDRRVRPLYDEVPELRARCIGGPAHGMIVGIEAPLQTISITVHTTEIGALGLQRKRRSSAVYYCHGISDSEHLWVYGTAPRG